MKSKLCFLQVKAFGDFVIANSAASRVVEAEQARISIAQGTHLSALSEAIRPTVSIVEVDVGEEGVPSIFDTRRAGWGAAIHSAWRLRRAVARAEIDDAAVLVLDRANARERFVVGGRRLAAMPVGTRNIYEGYDTLLGAAGFTLPPPVSGQRASRARHVGIFPGSRNAPKDIPIGLVTETIDQLRRRDVPVTLFLLDEERPDLVAAEIPHVLVPRRFAELRDAIASVDMVISADSLPGHLAEYLGRSVFVLLPAPNEFWMPRSVFVERRWCSFDDPRCVRQVVACALAI